MLEKYHFLTFMNKLRYAQPSPPPCNRSFCFSFQPEITVQDLHFIRFGTWPNCQCSILRKHFDLFLQVKQRKFISCINFVDLVTGFLFYLFWDMARLPIHKISGFEVSGLVVWFHEQVYYQCSILRKYFDLFL